MLATLAGAAFGPHGYHETETIGCIDSIWNSRKAVAKCSLPFLNQGGIIFSVSEASATYCAHLAREAIEKSAVPIVVRGNALAPHAARTEFQSRCNLQTIEFLGREYHLDAGAAAIVKVL